MKEYAEKIQVAINTLETITIPATYENVGRMTGIYRLLFEAKLGIENAEQETTTEPEDPEP